MTATSGIHEDVMGVDRLDRFVVVKLPGKPSVGDWYLVVNMASEIPTVVSEMRDPELAKAYAKGLGGVAA